MAVAPTLSAYDRRRTREILDALRVSDACSTSVFETLLPALRDLVGADAVCAYGLRQDSPTTYAVSFDHFVGPVPEAEFHSLFAAFVQKSNGVRWGSYNPGRPEPAQRNRLVSMPWRTMTEERQLPIVLELYPKLGVANRTQTRILICDGPSLLAWVGTWHEGACEPRQRAIFAALTPALRRRLTIDRQVEQSPRLGVFDAVMGAIGKAAFVVNARGQVREANRMGAELLRLEGPMVRDELAAAVRASPLEHPRWVSARVNVGASFAWLVMARSSTGSRLTAQVARATARWSLTPRQGVILELVAEGNGNRTIAAMAAVSERTVEVHVTALFEKAQVECRAELVASVYTLD